MSSIKVRLLTQSDWSMVGMNRGKGNFETLSYCRLCGDEDKGRFDERGLIRGRDERRRCGGGGAG